MTMTKARLAALTLALFAGATEAPAVFLDPIAAARLSDPADVNADGVVNTQDLTRVLAKHSQVSSGPEDVNNDGVVDAQDMNLVLGSWSSLPSINAIHMAGDGANRRVYIDSVVTIERSPLRADWTRIWAIDLRSGQLLGFDVDVYFEGTLSVLIDRSWPGPRVWPGLN
jgi:hypothetical protein